MINRVLNQSVLTETRFISVNIAVYVFGMLIKQHEPISEFLTRKAVYLYASMFGTTILDGSLQYVRAHLY